MKTRSWRPASSGLRGRCAKLTMARAGSSSSISCQRAPRSAVSSRSPPVDRPSAAGLMSPRMTWTASSSPLTLDAMRAARRSSTSGPRRRGDGRHDALGRFPRDLRLVPLEVLEEFFVRLVGNEPQRQFPQGDEVVGTEEVSEGLGTSTRPLRSPSAPRPSSPRACGARGDRGASPSAPSRPPGAGEPGRACLAPTSPNAPRTPEPW